ncbi:MAG TPA: DUF3500 domain-containing protein [Candidatus Limnocylindrales bacterium]|nr:DUF3500 domain-containing protein [Candidatus Limnocylindrales bacterium]
MTASDLTRAVVEWLDLLDAQQREAATFDFDDPERYVWAFTPGERDGLAIRDMDAQQRDAAMAIVRSALSARGAREVTAIIELETVLGELERQAGRSNWRRRDPVLFWFAVFGDPARPDRAPWMWRVGGHHVAIHMTVADGQVIGSSPSFLGANPAVIPSGPRAGERTLTGEELLARELVTSLSEDEWAVAIVDPVAPPEILTSNAARADAGRVPRGLGYAEMSADARARLERLIRHYVSRAADDVAAGDWRRVVADGLGETTFAWAGSTEPGRGHYYAVRGPRLLIEYDNTQNGANHVHSVWRDLANDWGGDTLAAHYRSSHPAARDWRSRGG